MRTREHARHARAPSHHHFIFFASHSDTDDKFLSDGGATVGAHSRTMTRRHAAIAQVEAGKLFSISAAMCP